MRVEANSLIFLRVPEQEVAPFPRRKLRWTVAKASSGLIPQPFLIRVFNTSKRTMITKKPFGISEGPENLRYISRISPSVADAAVACTCNRGRKYVVRFVS